MRLRKIRLAGFKSFVDPTTISLPGDLIGIVGPNGCGKSNVIDAVRWVMGEVSARHLRGETMADVVFNGSSARKPVGQASVELIFDNSDGRAGGRFAGFAEISVRRQVGRDGPSAYFLNGTRCRRRDVMDLFLGTGLGPRSYAVIEQGMISRIVEGRPEELREFLEEAAGISKYKERRRDTENRIHHTRENLERLADLRAELASRLGQLERQARTAERYKRLREEERRLGAELHALRWRELAAEGERREVALREQETRLEAALAAQREVEARLERRRVEHAGAVEAFNERYRAVLEAGAAIARTEEAIQAARRRREELEARRARERREIEAARAHLAGQRRQGEALAAEIERQTPALEQAEAAATRAREVLEGCERELEAWQGRYQVLNEAAAGPERVVHAEGARVEQLAASVRALEERAARTAEALASLDGAAAEAAAEACERRVEAARERLAELAAALEAARERVREAREQSRQAGERLHRLRERLEHARGRLASLQALQEEALGAGDGAGRAWLARQGLGDAPRLAECLEVEPGWEWALEVVLEGSLEAVCAERLDPHGEALGGLERGALGLIERGAGGRRPGAPERLLERVRAPVDLAPLLGGVRVADSLEEALASRAGLADGESVVTAAGEWLGRNWIRVRRRTGDGQGVLEREQALREQAAAVERLAAEVGAGEQALAAASEALGAAERELGELQGEHDAGSRGFAELSSALAEARARAEGARERGAALAAEAARIEERLAAERAALARAERSVEQAGRELAAASAERSRWLEQRARHQERLEQARAEWQRLREEVYASGVRLESMRTRAHGLAEGAEREAERLAALEGRLAEVEEQLAAAEAPVASARAELERLLEERAGRERELDAARSRAEALEGEVRELERSRHAREEAVGREREALAELRLAGEESRVRRETVEEQLAAAGFAAEALLAEIEDGAEPAAWEERLAALERRIARLGPINLAAIEEREQVAERKGYLDEQHADLEQALATLEAAIHKIDRETRARFKETYERVNAGLARSFPRLFGGGRAYLELTGDDLLSAGVAVMARPPGKRNSSIQQLSGGEKALAAVALVFAIFELNPAPFCLLDEVDAPLDDANVLRFCDLVREMSERVQFIVVTHNKTTMEITGQLIGVTMHEPGVSRLVAVDLEEAAAMAAQ